MTEYADFNTHVIDSLMLRPHSLTSNIHTLWCLSLLLQNEGEEGKTEYRVWNPFRSKLVAAILGGVDKIHIKPGSKVLYLGAASGTTVSHVADIVGPVSAFTCVKMCAMQLHPLPPSPCVCKNVATSPPPPPCLLTYLLYHSVHSITTHSITTSLHHHSLHHHSLHHHFTPSPLHFPSYLILQFISVSNSLHSPHYHFIPSPLHPITTHSIPSHSIPSHSITIHPITPSPFTPSHSPYHHFIPSPLTPSPLTPSYFIPSLLTNHHSPSSHQHFTPSSFISIHFITSHSNTTSPHHHSTISPNHSSPSTHSLTHRRVWCMLWSSLTAQGGT